MVACICTNACSQAMSGERRPRGRSKESVVHMVTLTELLAGLPSEPTEDSLFGEIQQELARSKRKLVVIDDDPTGTQTVHDIALLTTWNRHMLAQALQNEPRLFYLLTNSRSMPEGNAIELNYETAQQLAVASQETKTGFVVASRSDSTLRGHYPAEIQALERGITSSGGDSFDGHLLVPAFFEGGRYTIHDTHYVATPLPPLIRFSLQMRHHLPEIAFLVTKRRTCLPG